MSSFQSRYLGKLNRLQSLKQQVAFWEQAQDHYKQACQTFREYIDCIRVFRKPRALINAYIRMAKFCENMDDILYSRDLYQEAVNLMVQFELGGHEHVQRMRKKINSLSYFY